MGCRLNRLIPIKQASLFSNCFFFDFIFKLLKNSAQNLIKFQSETFDSQYCLLKQPILLFLLYYCTLRHFQYKYKLSFYDTKSLLEGLPLTFSLLFRLCHINSLGTYILLLGTFFPNDPIKRYRHCDNGGINSKDTGITNRFY